MAMIITGSRGFIGGHLTKLYPEAMTVDLLDGQDMTDMEIPEHNILINMAAISGIKACDLDRRRCRETNAIAPYDWHKAYPESYQILASSAAVNGHSFYGSTKREMEELLPNACILRFSNVYGPGSDGKSSVVAQMFKDALQTGQLTVNDGTQTRDFVHINDVISVIQQAVEGKWRGVFDVCSGKQTSIMEVGIKIAELTGARIVVNDVYEEDSVARTPYIEPMYPDVMNNLQETHEYFKMIM